MFVHRTDSQLQKAVLDELKWDTRVCDSDIGAHVRDGVVTLMGRVDSWAERVAAQEAAHRVVGVLDVANDIEVRPSSSRGRTDTELAQAVRMTLEWHALLPQERIRTTVDDGRVTLEGDVDSGAEREDAESAVRDLVGVRQVINRIVVKPRKAGLEHELRDAINAALTRQADREASRVELTLVDGHAKLSGTVRSLAERRAVLGAVRGTLGVTSVEDLLRVSP